MAPMPKCRFHRVALPVLVPIQITGNRLEHHVCESPEQFHVGIRIKALRIVQFGLIDGCGQFPHLLDDALVKEQRPAVSLDHSSTSSSISALGSTDFSRVTIILRRRSSGRSVICRPAGMSFSSRSRKSAIAGSS